MLNALLRRCVIVISIWPICSVELAFSVYVCISRMLKILRADVACWLGNNGHDYIGTVATTVNSKTCQAWSAQTPHAHQINVDSWFPDGSVAAAKNYCRNANSYHGGIWCHTVDGPVWELCDIPSCCELISWFPCSLS